VETPGLVHLATQSPLAPLTPPAADRPEWSRSVAATPPATAFSSDRAPSSVTGLLDQRWGSVGRVARSREGRACSARIETTRQRFGVTQACAESSRSGLDTSDRAPSSPVGLLDQRIRPLVEWRGAARDERAPCVSRPLGNGSALLRHALIRPGWSRSVAATPLLRRLHRPDELAGARRRDYSTSGGGGQLARSVGRVARSREGRACSVRIETTRQRLRVTQACAQPSRGGLAPSRLRPSCDGSIVPTSSLALAVGTTRPTGGSVALAVGTTRPTGGSVALAVGTLDQRRGQSLPKRSRV
jgi:hypothetical protein